MNRPRTGAMMAGLLASSMSLAGMALAQDTTETAPGCSDDALSYDNCATFLDVTFFTRHTELGVPVGASPSATPVGPRVDPGDDGPTNGGGSGSGGSGSGGSSSGGSGSGSGGSGSGGSGSGGSGSGGSGSGGSGSGGSGSGGSGSGGSGGGKDCGW